MMIIYQRALPDVLNASVNDFNFKNVLSTLGDVMYTYPFNLPPYYIALLRCLGMMMMMIIIIITCIFHTILILIIIIGVLEGVAMQIDGTFRIISQAYPYIAARLLTDPAIELQQALQQLLFISPPTNNNNNINNDNNNNSPSTYQLRLRYDRLTSLLSQAQQIDDYDLISTFDTLITYLINPEASSLRQSLTQEVIALLVQLEAEASALIVQFVWQQQQQVNNNNIGLRSVESIFPTSGNNNNNNNVVSWLQYVLSSKNALDLFQQLLDQLVVLQTRANGPLNPSHDNNNGNSQGSALYTLQTVIRLIRKQNNNHEDDMTATSAVSSAKVGSNNNNNNNNNNNSKNTKTALTATDRNRSFVNLVRRVSYDYII
jgi:hypothetical protein